MDEQNSSTNVDKIAKLVRSAAGVKSVGRDKRLFAVPDGISIVPEDVALNPGIKDTISIDRTENVGSPQAFVDFVEDYGTSNSIVFVDSHLGKASCIINYVPKGHGVAKGREPELGFRCDWKVNYSQTLSKNWMALNRLCDVKTTLEKARLIVTSLKDTFFELEDMEGEEFALREVDVKYLYPHILDAHLATEADLHKFIVTGKCEHKRMVANFAFPIHQGSNALELVVLIKQGSNNKVGFEILSKDRLVELSIEYGMSKIKTKLRSGFKVFDADLSVEDA